MTSERDQNIVRLATEHPAEISNQAIGDRYGITSERVRQIIAAAGKHKPRKLGAVFTCQKPKCSRQFRGNKRYGGEKARYCHQHRRQ